MGWMYGMYGMYGVYGNGMYDWMDVYRVKPRDM